MVVLSCTLSPFHGEVANRFRAAVDFAVFTSYMAALALAMLLEQTTTYDVSSTGTLAVLYYSSESDRETANAIAKWLPGLVGSSLICGWFTRAVVAPCKVRWAKRRVQPSLPPPPVDDGCLTPKSDENKNEGADAELEQNAALVIQRRQRTRSSARRLAAMLAMPADHEAAAATGTFGFAPMCRSSRLLRRLGHAVPS